MNKEKQADERQQEIMEGLKESFRDLVRFKRYKKTPFIFEKNGKIIKVDPEEFLTDKK
jgi:hypothetical protein